MSSAASDAVRTAAKRLITGNVMDQKSLGATRNDPWECFEDILARKNPRGYIKATLAFDQKLSTTTAIEAAYQKYLADNGGESKVLEAAQKFVTLKPNFAMQHEPQSLAMFIAHPPAAPAPVTLIDNPDYLAWQGFPPGAKVSYATQIWLPDQYGKLHPGHMIERHAYTLRSIDSDQANLYLTEIAYDADGNASPPHDTELAYKAKIAAPPARSPRQPGTPPTAARGKRGAIEQQDQEQPPATMPAPPLNAPLPSRANIIRGTPSPTGPQETGQEIIAVSNRKIPTQWQSQSYTGPSAMSPGVTSSIKVTVWTSDAVPTGLVRKTDDRLSPDFRTRKITRTIEQTWLESVTGARPGFPDANPLPSRSVPLHSPASSGVATSVATNDTPPTATPTPSRPHQPPISNRAPHTPAHPHLPSQPPHQGRRPPTPQPSATPMT